MKPSIWILSKHSKVKGAKRYSIEWSDRLFVDFICRLSFIYKWAFWSHFAEVCSWKTLVNAEKNKQEVKGEKNESRREKIKKLIFQIRLRCVQTENGKTAYVLLQSVSEINDASDTDIDWDEQRCHGLMHAMTVCFSALNAYLFVIWSFFPGTTGASISKKK